MQILTRDDTEHGVEYVTRSEAMGIIGDMEVRHAAVMLHTQGVVDEANAMREWIMRAAPVLNQAACIVIDDAGVRLHEIAGVRAILETCPVDFICANDQEEARRK
jgi:hypothetical protein